MFRHIYKYFCIEPPDKITKALIKN